MATQSQVSPRMRTASGSADLGAKVVALAGVGLVGYGIMFLVRNFNGFIELGLTPHHVGGTPEQIHAFSPELYNYISHLQVAVSAFIIALGVAVIALAWFGIRTRPEMGNVDSLYHAGNWRRHCPAPAFCVWHRYAGTFGADLFGCRDPAGRYGPVL